MSKESQRISNEMSQLADHANALLAATADAAGDHVSEARRQLTATLEAGKNKFEQFAEKAKERTSSCDRALHENPYMAMGAAAGIGALIGYFMANGSCSRRY